MAAIFQGDHIGVERLPSIAHQHYSTGGSELPRDAATLQGRGITLPRQRFRSLRLAECFEQANAGAVGIQAVDVVQDNWLMPVLVGFEVDAKGGGLAADPANRAAQRLADAVAFADAGRTEDH